ncbi:hypothetical protein [Paenibacillus hexagrammi]|uniref:Uncharacterized protein n=1 Tax=Paenibacillus hexagrammi TaxID=2908839 RepID=A0ABY3SRQ9_9BACL|nr:hypothetical protein [Paenibacillus sp. YPD9-1]UJF36148.1 hypothetical protein L0M14_14430 [Paenibacillus sp. YPD9-1]
MKLRLLPLVASVIVSATVLFGGWFAYNSLAMENPLSQIVSESSGIESSSIKLDSEAATIDLELKPDADLRAIVSHIADQGSSILGKRTVQYNVKSNSSPELESWWSKALFDVAQAMETKQYTDIPKALESYASELPNLKVSTEMDDQYVYVRLTDGEFSKFVMLPRTSSKIGVWPNE